MMTWKFAIVVLLLLLVLGLVLWLAPQVARLPIIAGEEEAQSQSADTEAQAHEADAEAQPQETDAETQPQVADAKAKSQPAKVEAHGDWALQCPETGPCFLIQRIFLKDNKDKPLISFTLQFSGEPSRLLIALRTPLDVMLTSGVELGVDKGKATTYPFHHCRPAGCLAIFPVSQQLRKNLKAGERANIGYSLTNGKKYGVPVSLKGISAGLQALKKATEKAAKEATEKAVEKDE